MNAAPGVESLGRCFYAASAASWFATLTNHAPLAHKNPSK